MLKQIFEIAKNRAKVQFADFLLEILISTANEFRRANKEGEFDLTAQKRQNEPLPERNPEINSVSQPEQKTSLFNSLFK